jgi:hypothetical protein
MDEYIKIYDTLDKHLVVDFTTNGGGIGDFIKYFTFLLSLCINHNIKFHYIRTNNLDKYILLKYPQFFIQKSSIINKNVIKNINDISKIIPNTYNIVRMHTCHGGGGITKSKNIDKLNSIFYFSHDVKTKIADTYISIHLRFGDKHLETDSKYICCKHDSRSFNEEKLYKCIENNKDKKIAFFCDNKVYKLKLKEKYPRLIITDYEIGHTALRNTTEQQTLDAVREYYLLTESEHIYAASRSGFSLTAAKFNGTPLTNLY